MLTADENRLLTEVGPGTPMGDYLRRYWQPIAGLSELDQCSIKPIRLFGEDLVLYKDLSGRLGLVDRHCAHRRADLLNGMVEERGLRCSYHGWCFDEAGACIARPFEDIARGAPERFGTTKIKAYKVEVKAAMIWAYLGPDPAPLLPDWEPFSWKNGFVQIMIADIPCNWFQCQENSIDPVHFEWMHEVWGNRLRGAGNHPVRKHLKLRFEEFEHGFTYHRVREQQAENDGLWTVGRAFLWPNCFFLGEHFEYRVPTDDLNTRSIIWKYTRVPREQEPYVQGTVPTWHGPVFLQDGSAIRSHIVNQDFISWIGQGRIADRTKENIGLSDRGIVMVRQRFFEELRKVAAGADAKATFRDPATNVAVPLPIAMPEAVKAGYTKAEILADPMKQMITNINVLQAGQPESIRRIMSDALGLEVKDLAVDL